MFSTVKCISFVPIKLSNRIHLSLLIQPISSNTFSLAVDYHKDKACKYNLLKFSDLSFVVSDVHTS